MHVIVVDGLSRRCAVQLVDADAVRVRVDLRPGADLHHLVGERLPFLVTQYAKKGRDIVVSRKPMLEATAERLREEQLAKIEAKSEVA